MSDILQVKIDQESCYVPNEGGFSVVIVPYSEEIGTQSIAYGWGPIGFGGVIELPLEEEFEAH